jgi:uncharacterized protein YjaG (DUF416 family)
VGDIVRTRLDKCLDEMQHGLEKLQRRSLAAFFAGCAERLLPLYERFSRKEAWGEPQVLREVLNEVWGYLEGGPAPDTRRRLEQVAAATPHGGEFDSPGSTFAQDAVICIDAALRACSEFERVDVRWIEYPIEASRIAACLRETGFVSLEGKERVAWEDRALEEPPLRSEIELYRGVIRSLQKDQPIDPSRAAALREEMRASVFDFDIS